MNGCAKPPTLAPPELAIRADAEAIVTVGRTQADAEGSIAFSYPGVQMSLRTIASHISLNGWSTKGENRLDIFINSKFSHRITLPQESSVLTLFEANKATPVTLRLVHSSETWQGVAHIDEFSFDGPLLTPPIQPSRKLLVIGDSITCGEAAIRPSTLGPECQKTPNWWSAPYSYGLLLGEKLHAQTQLVCYGGRGLTRSWNGVTTDLNAPQFYDKTIPADARAPDWNQKQYPADIILIVLGTNDFSRSAGDPPDEKNFISTYVAFLDKVLQDHTTARVFISDGPMVMDDEFSEQKTVLRSYLSKVKNAISDDRVKLAFIPHQPGDRCDAHPTRTQHKVMADAYFRRILPFLD